MIPFSWFYRQYLPNVPVFRAAGAIIRRILDDAVITFCTQNNSSGTQNNQSYPANGANGNKLYVSHGGTEARRDCSSVTSVPLCEMTFLGRILSICSRFQCVFYGDSECKVRNAECGDQNNLCALRRDLCAAHFVFAKKFRAFFLTVRDFFVTLHDYFFPVEGFFRTFTIFSLRFALFSLRFALFSLRFALFSLRFTLFSLRFALLSRRFFSFSAAPERRELAKCVQKTFLPSILEIGDKCP